MKKIDAQAFTDDVSVHLESFLSDMVSRNFSKRNKNEWFKLLGDYLGLSLPNKNSDLNDIEYNEEKYSAE